MTYLLGIDNGLTVSKAVLFDAGGKAVATARRRVEQLLPRAHFVERDMDMLWKETAAAIREVLEVSGISPDQVAGVAATAHGDGVYLVDGHARPVRPGILSLDSRAAAIVAGWEHDGTSQHSLQRTGQTPHASAPSALLAWVRDNEPEVFARIGTIIAAKDWLRLCLTGTLGTDLTEASTSFTDVSTQRYGEGILDIFGLGALASALPEVSAPSDVVGHVTANAAWETGLAEGTPVVAGLHDVTASALGVGGYAKGVVAIVAGTYSINETVTHAPKTGAAWFCRNGIASGEWNNMAISPASAANYDWFLDQLMVTERDAQGTDIHSHVAQAIAGVARSEVLFHPYLFGSPYGAVASASFLGLRGWHGRLEMLRAVIEGIAFNHRVHIDALRDAFEIETARLTGGISRNPAFCQIFTNALGLPVEVAEVEEAAAWGAALCAGAGVGLFDTPRAAPQTANQVTYHPEPDGARELDALFSLFRDASDALAPIWRKLADIGGSP